MFAWHSLGHCLCMHRQALPAQATVAYALFFAAQGCQSWFSAQIWSPQLCLRQNPDLVPCCQLGNQEHGSWYGALEACHIKAAFQQTHTVYRAAIYTQCHGKMGTPGLSCDLPPQFQLGTPCCSLIAGNWALSMAVSSCCCQPYCC